MFSSYLKYVENDSGHSCVTHFYNDNIEINGVGNFDHLEQRKLDPFIQRVRMFAIRHPEFSEY